MLIRINDRQQPRKQLRRGSATPVALSVLCALVFAVSPSRAEPTALELLSKADKDLRAAERAMFAGNKEEADKILQEVGGALSKLKAMAPSDSKTGMLQSKFDKLRRDLDKRMGVSSPKVATERPAAAVPERTTGRTAPGSRVGGADSGAAARAAAKDKAASAAAAAASKDEAVAGLRADAESMGALHEKYFKHLENIHGNSLFYGTEAKDAEQALATIEEAEKVLPELAPEMGRLAELYGSRGMDIYNKFFEAGYKLEDNVEGKFERLVQAVAKLPATRTASADSVATMAATLLSPFSGQITDAHMERMQQVKALLVVGNKMDPNHPRIGDMLSKIDDQIAEAAEKMTASIDAARWPGHIDDFPGPGSAKALAEEALKFFRNHPSWKDTGHETEVLAVAIRGPWQVAERDIFGRVIGWRLPALVASTDERFRPRNLARVLEVSILAQEGAPDKAPKAPPFSGYWVGNNWMMRLNKL